MEFFYRVISGDNIISISKTFNVPPISLIKRNNLKEEVSAGDILIIEKKDLKLYICKPFDTLSSVAKSFSVTEDYLINLNGITYLYYGLIIYI